MGTNTIISYMFAQMADALASKIRGATTRHPVIYILPPFSLLPYL